MFSAGLWSIELAKEPAWPVRPPLIPSSLAQMLPCCDVATLILGLMLRLMLELTLMLGLMLPPVMDRMRGTSGREREPSPSDCGAHIEVDGLTTLYVLVRLGWRRSAVCMLYVVVVCDVLSLSGIAEVCCT